METEKTRIKLETPHDQPARQPDDFENEFQCTDELEIGKEFKSEPLAIIHNPDDNLLPSENEFQYTDEIEVGEEFKSELLTNKLIHDGKIQQSVLESLTFYCNQCNKTLNLLEKKTKKCDSCKSKAKFKCGKCMKVYSFMHLNRHLKIHSKKVPKFFCCDHCKYKTNNKSHLINHITARHLPRDPNLFKCSKCKKSFLTQMGLNYHSKTCGQTKDFKRSLGNIACSQCEYKTLYKSNLNRHIREKHLRGDSKLKCKKCAKVYLNPESLKQHLKRCGQTDDVKRSLMSYSCDLCDVKTFTKVKILEHIQAKHLPRELSLTECKKCGKTYANLASLKNHLLKYCKKSENLKQSSIRYSCDHCSYETIRKDYLASHIQTNHLPRDPEANKCSKCGKNYAFRKTLLAHSKVCSQTKGFQHSIKSFFRDL